MTKEEIINHLKTAYLPENLECDGGLCTGCWKDVISQSIKMIEEYDKETSEKNSEIERLKAELEAKSELLELYRRNSNRSQDDYLLEIDRHKNHIKVLQSELNELKEEYETDLEYAFKAGRISDNTDFETFKKLL